MSWRWISNRPDRRTNSGMQESWHFATEELAIEDAVNTASGKPVTDPDTRHLLWQSLKAAGWKLTTGDRGPRG